MSHRTRILHIESIFVVLVIRIFVFSGSFKHPAFVIKDPAAISGIRLPYPVPGIRLPYPVPGIWLPYLVSGGHIRYPAGYRIYKGPDYLASWIETGASLLILFHLTPV